MREFFTKLVKLIIEIKSIMNQYRDDHVSAFAAQAAFFILLSFFPFMIFLLTMTRYLPIEQTDILTLLLQVVPAEVRSLVSNVVNDMYSRANGTVLSISIIGALWSASRGILSITRGLNTIYGTNETRNYFVLRFFSLIYTLIFSIILMLLLVLVVFGNSLYGYILKVLPMIGHVVSVIMQFRMLGIAIVFVCFFLIMYRFIPNQKGKLKYQLPGAVLTTVGWSLISMALSVYVEHFGNLSYMYGSLTGVVVVMLWLYFCMTLFFVGAEINHYLAPKKLYY